MRMAGAAAGGRSAPSRPRPPPRWRPDPDAAPPPHPPGPAARPGPHVPAPARPQMPLGQFDRGLARQDAKDGNAKGGPARGASGGLVPRGCHAVQHHPRQPHVGAHLRNPSATAAAGLRLPLQSITSTTGPAGQRGDIGAGAIAAAPRDGHAVEQPPSGPRPAPDRRPRPPDQMRDLRPAHRPAVQVIAAPAAARWKAGSM